MKTALPSPSRPPLRSGAHALLAVGLLAFAVYGSWVPFHYQTLLWDEACTRSRDVCAQPIQVRSISDWTANVLLFVPIGYALIAAGCVDRAWWAGLVVVPVVICFCALLSIGIEFSQLYFPGRISSLSDVAAQVVGTCIGAVVWLSAGQRLTAWLREGWEALGSRGITARILPAYLVFLLLVHTMPFDLTLSPAELYHKYRAGRIHVLPFDFGHVTLYAALAKQIWNLFYFIPLGFLLSRLDGPRWREVRSWWRVAAIGLAVAATIQFAKLFVESRNCEASDVIVDALAVLLGWAVSILPLPATENNAGEGKSAPAPSVQHLIAALDRRWLLVGWLAILLFLNWYPFDVAPGRATEHLSAITLVPFADYQAATPYQAFDQALHRILLFVPLGALLAALLGDGQGLWGVLPVTLAGAFALVIEAGQVLLPTRVPGVTDVILGTSGAWAGQMMFRHMSSLVTQRRPAGEVT